MFEILDTPKAVVDWCRAHPKCKGCRFRANQCQAPDSDRDYSKWQRKMHGLIEAENAKTGN